MAGAVTVQSLLSGCCHEAERAYRVAHLLAGLRNSLSADFHVHMDALIDECRRTGRKLQEITDTCQLRMSKVPLIINYISLVLPCIGRSLRDMTGFYEDKSRPKTVRWERLYHKMSDELPGTNITARFGTYCDFLEQLRLCISMAPQFNPNYLEVLSQLIISLRSVRGMDPPTPVSQELVVRSASKDPWNSTRAHWVQSIFGAKDQAKFHYDLKKSGGSYNESKASCRFYPIGKHPSPSPDANILSEHSFTQGRIRVIIYLEMPDSVPFIYLRMTDPQGQGHVSILGAHELRVMRKGASGLLFTRYSKTYKKSVDWAELYFKTWEELVLFHSTFMTLKTYSPFTVNNHPLDFKIDREKCLFREKIIDHGYEHTLSVLKDKKTGCHRLLASIRGEDMIRHCPVWTAFLLPGQISSGDSWIMRKTNRQVWLRNVHPYIFSNDYRPKYTGGQLRALEIRFTKEEASREFNGIFGTATETTITTESSDATA